MLAHLVIVSHVSNEGINCNSGRRRHGKVTVVAREVLGI
jgi:hypothetical protein